MKKYVLIAILVLALGVLSGCGKMTDKKPDDVSEIINQKTSEAKTDYISKYEDILADVYEFIVNIDNKVGADKGFQGVWDAAHALGENALDQIGFMFEDVNGDDVSELLIGAFDKNENAYTGNEIYALYTLKNDKPALVFEGWSRSSYALRQDGSFFYQGSGGAAYSIFGSYHISTEGELICDDFYFTYPKDEDPAVVEIFYNTEGIFDRNCSEKQDMSLDAFWELGEETAKGTAKLSGTPFAELDASIVQKALAVKHAPDSSLLEGEWTMVSGMVDGDEYTAEEAGYTTELSISGKTAYYRHVMGDVAQSFDAELVYLDEPIYDGCGNDEWSVMFELTSSDFGAEDEFYATLIDENTLLFQQFFPFDGTQGVSYQTYKRK